MVIRMPNGTRSMLLVDNLLEEIASRQTKIDPSLIKSTLNLTDITAIDYNIV
jgi:hypothetical protein